MSTHISSGPRGRRFLFELLSTSGGDLGQEIHGAIWELSYPIDQADFVMVAEADVQEDGTVPSPPELAPGDIACLIQKVELSPTSEQVSDALADAVTWAAYWQEPGAFDVTLADPQIHAVLAEIDDESLLIMLDSQQGAEATTEVSAAVQLSVSWVGLDQPSSEANTILADWQDGVTRSVERSKRDKPDDPEAPWSGMWYSIPPSSLPSSGGVTPSGIPEALHYVEDGPPRDDAIISRIETQPERLYVIDSAQAWAALCDRYPFDVTAEVRQDWYRITGRDGRWVIPNWLEVSRDWDAVMLTRRAYLSEAGNAIQVADAASVIAGWNPWETYWLTDAVTLSDRERWTISTDRDTWRPAR